MMTHSRAHIRLTTTNEVNDFVSKMNSDGSVNKFVIEDWSCNIRVDARSLMGVLYAMTDFNDEMYLVNLTKDGSYPLFVDAYRV